MRYLQVYTQKDIDSLTIKREGETKFGACVQTLNSSQDIAKNIRRSTANYVLVGVPEDIGVRMNGGVGGAHTAWKMALKSLCNIQENNFNKGSSVLILGYMDFSKELKKLNIADDDFKEKGDSLVRLIDEELSALVRLIIEAQKIPIIVGGGHNNSYGNIKGASEALREKINVVNLDAHTDFRILEERHSGNGFSYAYNDGYLNKYYIFGIHENYTPDSIFSHIDTNPDLQYTTFEEVEIYKNKDFFIELENAKKFVSENYFGIEIDLDAIASFPSSAMSPSGFLPTQARQFTTYFGGHKNAIYLHICEASPSILNQQTASGQVGKFISYLISDFIKSKDNH